MSDKPTTDNLELCKRAIDAACEQYGCFLVAVPAFKPDRGDWLVSTRIEVLLRPKP